MSKIFIYLDESGDLGFNKGSSKHFVISFLVMSQKTNLLLKRKFIEVKRKYNISKGIEIKGNKSSYRLRMDILKEICSLPIDIYSITTKKQGINETLRKDTNIFYNYMVNLIVVPYLEKTKANNICLIADKRISKVSKGIRFGDYLKYKIFYEKNLYHLQLNIEYLDSITSYGLQAVDFVANSIFKNYEQDNKKYIETLEGNIVQNKRLYFNS
ncbi:MAG: DUF3800 domain-containing protein [Bacteroidales bacterium]|nr:DUF3800 domain-containing protein [Actinomycetota bacterium]MDX9797318.1 DUF3800 domain-containing protein [Bacteroidales bacterium]